MAVMRPSPDSKATVSIAPSSPRSTRPGRPLTVAARTSRVAKPAFLRETPSRKRRTFSRPKIGLSAAMRLPPRRNRAPRPTRESAPRRGRRLIRRLGERRPPGDGRLRTRPGNAAGRRQYAPAARRKLTAGRFAAAERAAHFGKIEAEHIVQQKARTLERRKPLKDKHQRD